MNTAGKLDWLRYTLIVAVWLGYLSLVALTVIRHADDVTVALLKGAWLISGLTFLLMPRGFYQAPMWLKVLLPLCLLALFALYCALATVQERAAALAGAAILVALLVGIWTIGPCYRIWRSWKSVYLRTATATLGSV